MWAGRYILARRRGRWEWAARARDIGAVVIVAVDDGHVLLVEQYREPLGRRCLELPAGLVDDDATGEAIEDAARRELEEETGWRASSIETLGEFASSPGMVSETFTLVRAHGLTKVGDGGGTCDEQIVVHRVGVDEVGALIASARDNGMMIDVKLLALIPLIRA